VNESEIIDIEQKMMANTYSKRPIVLTKGRGALLWDINGKEYIDCMGAYGVALIGHSHPKVVQAINDQAEKLISCHGTYYNDIRSELLNTLTSITPKGVNKAFLSTSGAESVECAIKLARKHTGKTEIISMMGAFHGKSMGALSATWRKRYREPFQPLIPGFKFVPFGRPEAVINAITDETAAVITEPIQGEGGIKVPPQGFLKELREICTQKEILFIVDEIQTGFGRTGKFFACEHEEVIPDVMCIAKAVAGGFPMGITVAREDVMTSLGLGDHSSTFGGNPLACAAAKATIDVLIEEKLPERAKTLGNHFKEILDAISEEHRIVRESRGLGMMLAMEFRFDVLNMLLDLMNRGVLVIDAGRNILRFLPPLVITKEQIEQATEVLELVVQDEEERRIRH
jgi:acetylornithine/LysW-gamma-L-lysine aminotransferase